MARRLNKKVDRKGRLLGTGWRRLGLHRFDELPRASSPQSLRASRRPRTDCAANP